MRILLFVMIAIIAIGFWVKELKPANAGILDDIKTAITGHVKDAKSRFTDDQVIESMILINEGIFDETADGQDFAHWAKGSVSIVHGDDGKNYVQLNSDFNSGPLPDGHVYISLLDSDINNESDFNFDRQIDLGELKKGKGASFYEVPNHLPASLIKSVTIWCKAFGEYIGSADVK